MQVYTMMHGPKNVKKQILLELFSVETSTRVKNTVSRCAGWKLPLWLFSCWTAYCTSYRFITRGHIQKLPDFVDKQLCAFLVTGRCSPLYAMGPAFLPLWKHQWNWLSTFACRTVRECCWISGTFCKRGPRSRDFIPGNKEKSKCTNSGE